MLSNTLRKLLSILNSFSSLFYFNNKHSVGNKVTRQTL